MNETFLSAIKKFEGFTARAEWDYAQNSNGFGTRARYAGEVIDRSEAERRFKAEISDAEAKVTKFAPNLEPGAKAALTSLTFNAGPTWMKSGLGAAVRAGDWDTARQKFLQYNKAGGEVLSGLTSRRVAEANWIGGGSDQGLQVAEAHVRQDVPHRADRPAVSASVERVAMASADVDRMSASMSRVGPGSDAGTAVADIRAATAQLHSVLPNFTDFFDRPAAQPGKRDSSDERRERDHSVTSRDDVASA